MNEIVADLNKAAILREAIANVYLGKFEKFLSEAGEFRDLAKEIAGLVEREQAGDQSDRQRQRSNENSDCK